MKKYSAKISKENKIKLHKLNKTYFMTQCIISEMFKNHYDFLLDHYTLRKHKVNIFMSIGYNNILKTLQTLIKIEQINCNPYDFCYIDETLSNDEITKFVCNKYTRNGYISNELNAKINFNLDISRQYFYAQNDIAQLILQVYPHITEGTEIKLPFEIYNKKPHVLNNNKLITAIIDDKINKYIIDICTETPTTIKSGKNDYKFDIFGIIKTKNNKYFQFVIETDEKQHYTTTKYNDIIKDIHCFQNCISLLRLKINKTLSDANISMAINFLSKIRNTNLPQFIIPQEYINAKTNNFAPLSTDIILDEKYNFISNSLQKLRQKLSYPYKQKTIKLQKISKL